MPGDGGAPRDPDEVLDVAYEARRRRDQPDVGGLASLEIEVDGISNLCAAPQADIVDQIHTGHGHGR